MGPIRLLTAPIRRIANSRLFQLAVVVSIILLLDHYSYDYAPLRPIADGLKKSVTATVELFAKYFRVGILTDPVLQVGLMIAYVYVVCLLIFFLLRVAIRALVDLIAWSNFLWLRSTIARERGIAAYRAWVPLEKIRPADCSQQQWEEQFAWPADDKPPYPPLPQRLLRGAISYVVVFGAAAVALQLFTPFPVLTWLGRLINAPSG
jgi:small-conductance mechanosensitive channel